MTTISVPLEISMIDVQNLVNYLNTSEDDCINEIVERILMKTTIICEDFKETIDAIQKENPYTQLKEVSK